MAKGALPKARRFKRLHEERQRKARASEKAIAAGEAYALQDQVNEAIAPTIEERRVEIRDAGWAAIKSARGDAGSDWTARHRRWMPVPVKAWLIARLGRRVYERAFPW